MLCYNITFNCLKYITKCIYCSGSIIPSHLSWHSTLYNFIHNQLQKKPVPKNELTTDIKADQSLDAKGLNCPLPILKTKVILNKMQAGEILYVEATDPHSVVDFEAYCARTEHELMQVVESEELYEFFIRRADDPKKF